MEREGRKRIGLAVGQLTYGGAESQLCELACCLRDACDVFVYCLSGKGKPYADRLAAAGIPVRLLPARGNFDPGRVYRLASWLERDGIHLVHAFLFIASAYAYLATRVVRRVRLVTSARNCKLESNPLRRTVIRRAFRRSDAIICNSQEMARFARRHYKAPLARTHVVYNGVDVERFGTGRRDDRVDLVVGTLGRLERQKNIEMFFDAAAGLARRIPEVRFLIGGAGSEKAHLQEYALRVGLGGRAAFVGTTGDVPRLLAGLDQFWLTSDWEGTPNVVLEAMAAGLPVVATRVGGVPEVIEDGRTGFLVGRGDAQAVCERGLQLATDSVLARNLGTQAREAVRARFSIPAMVEATSRVYQNVVGGTW